MTLSAAERTALIDRYERGPALLRAALATIPTEAMQWRATDADWARTGTHTESGRYGAADWLRSYAEHLEIHARQLERNLAAWRNR